MKMTLIAAMLAVTCVCAVQADAQFRMRPSDEPSAAGSFVHPPTSEAWLGFFNPDNFTMRHSYSMSYSAFGSQGVALGRYTNTMEYKISDKLDVRAAVSMQHSPYNTFDKSMQSGLNGLMLDRAELNYRPTENMFVRVSFRQIPNYYGYNGYNGYYGRAGYGGYNSGFMMGSSVFDDDGYGY